MLKWHETQLYKLDISAKIVKVNIFDKEIICTTFYRSLLLLLLQVYT